jgi:hypothetical protein
MTNISYATLHHQFILSRNYYARVDGWHGHFCGGYSLVAHPSLPVNGVLDKEENEIGYVLGWPIDQSGKLVGTQIRLPFQVSARTVESVEKIIYSFGGRYVFVVLTPEVKRLYLDAGGTLAAVYSAKRKMACSTLAALVLDEPEHPLWSTPLGEFPDNKPNQYWPAGNTLDPHVSRLLPNHYLDLVNWRAIRHYPKSTLEAISEKDLPDCIEKIVSLLRRHIAAVLENSHRVYMPLTAGRDSRMLLACSRASRDKVEYVTFDYRPWRRQRGDRVDLYISQRLEKRFGLRQLIIPISRNLPPGTELQYLHRIGFAGGAGKSRDFFWACHEHLDLTAAWLTGFAGEVGRAFYSRSTDSETDKMSPAEHLRRMNLPQSDRLQDAMRAWLQELPDLPLSTLLDFVYLEHRLGCWAAPHLYGAAPFSINMMPFSHREIFDTMLRLPPAYRFSRALAGDIISTAWPELLALPHNDYLGIRRLLGPSSWIGRSKQKARSAIKRVLVHQYRTVTGQQ